MGPPYGKLPILFPYHSHIFRDSYGSGMGIVWVRGPMIMAKSFCLFDGVEKSDGFEGVMLYMVDKVSWGWNLPITSLLRADQYSTENRRNVP